MLEHPEILRLMRQSFGRRIIEIITDSYEIRKKRHEQLIGDNAMTFGMNVRFTVELLLDQEFSGRPGFEITRPLGSFQLAHEGHVFHFYKFGNNPGDNIDLLTFDDSATKMKLVENNQLSLPGLAQLRHWVIAHSGNPQQGLIDIYIGAPDSFGERGSPWAWRERISSFQEQMGFAHIDPTFFD